MTDLRNPIAYHAITLEPGGVRSQTFLARNAHLGPINIFKAIRGIDIPRDVRVSSGLMTQELVDAGTVKEGTVGCAASHREMWRHVAASNDGAVIMEDDVVTHPHLGAYIAAHIEGLRKADIVFFSVNTDAVLQTVSPQGLVSRELMHPKTPDLAWITNAFQQTALPQVQIFRLLKGFGLCCYWVSPIGAKKLLESCYPLTQDGTDIPFMKDKWPGSAIDGRMNAFYPSMLAFVTRPFLAYSPNNDSSTSV